MCVFADYEDDILDILSDGDTEPPKRRTKLKHNKKSEANKPDDKPITLPTTEAPGPSLAMDTHTHTKKSSDAKSTVTFDDDDDVLGGLGFDEPVPTTASRSPTATSAGSNSRLDDLLGMNKPSGKSSAKAKTKPVTVQDAKTTAASDPDNSFQFGSYVPSSVESKPKKRSSLKIPSGRRRGSSDIDPTLVTRPSTASSVPKKSVRFPDDPGKSSSATATAAVVKSPKRERREPVKEDSGSPDRGGVDTPAAAQVLTLDNRYIHRELVRICTYQKFLLQVE